MSDMYQYWIAKALAALAGSGFSVALSNERLSHNRMAIIFAFGAFSGVILSDLAILVIEKQLDIELGSGIVRHTTGAFIVSALAYFGYLLLVRILKGSKSTRDITGRE